MNEIDDQISKLEAEIQKLKELREKEKKSKVNLFDGVHDAEVVFCKIQENSTKTPFLS
jgi:uncharacterized protein YdcH (DUF465 family)